MNILDISSPKDSFDSIVFETESQRLINNANENHNFAVYVRFTGIRVEKTTKHGIVGRISERDYLNVIEFNDRVLDVLNNSPAFGEEQHYSLLPSLVRVNSKGEHLIRFSVTPESYFFQDEDVLDHRDLDASKQIDTVVSIHLSFNLPEVQIDARIEEARVSDYIEEPKVQAKRKPVLF
jgi:hypothetical protein